MYAASLLRQHELKFQISNEYDNFTIFLSLCRGSCNDNNSTIKSLFKTIAEIRNFAMFKTTYLYRLEFQKNLSVSVFSKFLMEILRKEHMNKLHFITYCTKIICKHSFKTASNLSTSWEANFIKLILDTSAWLYGYFEIFALITYIFRGIWKWYLVLNVNSYGNTNA